MANMKIIKTILKKNTYLIYYVIIGFTTNILSLVIFKIKFEYFNTSSFQAQLLSFIIATTLNYFLNSKYTFKSRKYIDLKKIFKYLIGLFISFIFMRFIFIYLYNILKIDGFYSYLFALVIASSCFFLWQKFQVFRFYDK